MNNIKKRGLAVLILIFSGVATYSQQQFTYTQFIDNLTPMNPAWSLTQDEGQVNILGRKQWLNVEGAPSTIMANGFAPIKSVNASFGFTALSDKVAIENLTEINLFLAKAVQLSDELFLSTAINGGVRRYNALYSNLDPLDPALVNTDLRETKGNIGASVLLFIPDQFYAGVSLPRIGFQNLGEGSVTTSRNFKNFYFFNVGYTYHLSDEFKLENAAVVAYTANVPLQADLSTKFYVQDAFGLGLNYRSNNELAVLSSYKAGNFRVGYSYQFGFGGTRVAGFNNSTHEITLGITFGSTGTKELRVRK
jgi:type IX secretion system PorP/SprF family membrane protein